MNVSIENKKTIPDISIDAKVLHDRLKQAQVGEVLTWVDLSKLIGRDVRRHAYGALNTARKRAQNDDLCVFGTVFKVGLKRLSDTEVVDTGQQVVDKVRRTTRRGVKRLTSVTDFSAMPNESKIKHNAYVSMLGALCDVSTTRRLHQVEKEVATANAAISMVKTLEIFK